MRYISIFLYSILILTLIHCSSSLRPTVTSRINFEQYKIEKLSELERSSIKITATCYYRNTYYAYPDKNKDSLALESLVIRKNITSNSVAGTGLILLQRPHKQLVLTCNHVFDFDDSLKTYYYDKERNQTSHLSSLAIKSGQSIYAYHHNGTRSEAQIVAVDEKNDLALIECAKIEIMFTELQFQGKFANTDFLKLGQEVYLLGFPKGFFIVTKGLASPSTFKNKFLVDAMFNRGFSGGIVISFSEQEPGYQYVGMANSIAYSSENILAPADEPQVLEQYNNIPYQGEIYVKELKLINYGLTFVIKSNVIVEFLKAESINLKRRGYDISMLGL